MCDVVERAVGGLPLLVLRHPREVDHVLGSADLVGAYLADGRVVTGLSWRHLAAAWPGSLPAPVGRWAVVFPHAWPRPGPPPAPGAAEVVTAAGVPLPAHELGGLVVLDGAWSQAKTLWWRNPWLRDLNRMRLTPAAPTIYGRLRRQPRADTCTSTLEAAAAALLAVGGAAEAATRMQRGLRTLVQRVRDAAALQARENFGKRRRSSESTPKRA